MVGYSSTYRKKGDGTSSRGQQHAIVVVIEARDKGGRIIQSKTRTPDGSCLADSSVFPAHAGCAAILTSAFDLTRLAH